MPQQMQEIGGSDGRIHADFVETTTHLDRHGRGTIAMDDTTGTPKKGEHRLIGHGLAIGHTVRLEICVGFAVETTAEFSDEARFAYATLPYHPHCLALAPGHLRPDGVQGGQLPCPAYKGCPSSLRVWHGGCTAQTLSEYRIDSSACCLPIHRHLRHGLEAHHSPY
jgi:hypothetical protein